MRTLIRLGWAQLAVVAGSLVAVLLVVWIAFVPEVEEFYAREFLLPRISERYGFQFGWYRSAAMDTPMALPES